MKLKLIRFELKKTSQEIALYKIFSDIKTMFIGHKYFRVRLCGTMAKITINKCLTDKKCISFASFFMCKYTII